MNKLLGCGILVGLLVLAGSAFMMYRMVFR